MVNNSDLEYFVVFLKEVDNYYFVVAAVDGRLVEQVKVVVVVDDTLGFVELGQM